MQRYESYKPSGVKWLGDVPAHWDVCRNIGLFDERKEINHPDMELLSVTINRGVIKQEEITEKKDSSNEDKSKYKLVRKDDLAYNKMRMWQGAIGRSEYEGIVSPAYIILSPRDKFYSRYYHYLYRTEAFITEANRHSYGLCLDMNSLRYEDFKTIYSPVPPRHEVERIVTFLDQKTADIDAAITKKERLIELLEVQRHTLIRHAVSCGLNTETTLKVNNAEWLEKTPSHWKIQKIKYCSKIFRGKFTHRPRNDPRLYDGPYPFIQTGDVARAGKFITEFKQTLNERGLRVSTLIPKGTIVITIAANIGDISILGFDACFPDSVVGFLPGSELERDYFYLALSVMKKQFMASSIQNTQMNLNVERIGSNSIAIPPLAEQKAIIEWADRVTELSESAQAKLVDEIGALREFKATVIANAVTGRFRI